MCEDLEKKYAALLLEYRQKVTAGIVAFFYQTAIRRMQSELRQKGNNSAQTMRFLF